MKPEYFKKEKDRASMEGCDDCCFDGKECNTIDGNPYPDIVKELNLIHGECCKNRHHYVQVYTGSEDEEISLCYSYQQNCFHFDPSFGEDQFSKSWAVISWTTRKEAKEFVRLMKWKYTDESGRRFFPYIPIVKQEWLWFERSKRESNKVNLDGKPD